MKTVKEKAKEWECSESDVREFCAIIPNAYKLKKFPFMWQIPDVPMPPFKPQLAVKYIEHIGLIKQGANIDFESLGYSIEKTEEFYEYLANNGYITKIEEKGNLNKRLKKASITTLGHSLVDNLQSKKTNKLKKTTKTAHIDANLGVVEAGASIKTVTENKELV